MRTLLLRRLSALCLALCTLLLASAAFALTPMEWVKGRYGEVNTILERPRAERDPLLVALVQKSIDFSDLAERSLGPRWATLTPDQQALYRQTFNALINTSYVNRLGDRDTDADYEIEWEEEETRGDHGRALILIFHEDMETEVDFSLKRLGADDWIIHDVAYDGASVEETYQKNHGEILDEEGFDALIQRMNERIVELGGEPVTTATPAPAP